MTEFIISQILGGIALILVCIGYFLKSKQTFLIFQTVANLFYASAFLVQMSLVGGIVTILSIVRCIYLYICEKKNYKYTLYFLPIFFVGYIVIEILFFKNIADIIPMFTAIFFTIAYVVKNLQAVRYLCLLPNVLLVLYNILCLTYTNAVLDLIEVIVLIVAIVYNTKRKNDIILKYN